ncbi:hypothetical protein DPMN_156275 [Dreissena polymorpha]|uniref:Uncharacterized protein n=1 Tax=Dreissena polymorpha TaxID=45954 RepID=A0A9D4JC69_DREPO|nr:hypothetical protein DPMN_156275 [Dreissena polymorpha]
MGSAVLQRQQRGSSGIEKYGLPSCRVNRRDLAVSRDGVCCPTESTEGSSGIERWGSVFLQSQHNGSSGIERWGSDVLQSQQRESSGIDGWSLTSYIVNTGV